MSNARAQKEPRSEPEVQRGVLGTKGEETRAGPTKPDVQRGILGTKGEEDGRPEKRKVIGHLMAYVDDIIVYTDGDMDAHMQDVGAVFDRLIEAGFTAWA